MNSDKILNCMYIVSLLLLRRQRTTTKQAAKVKKSWSFIKTTKHRNHNKGILASSDFHEVARADNQVTCRRRYGSQGEAARGLELPCRFLADDAQRHNRLYKARMQASDSLRRLEEDVDVGAVQQRASTRSVKNTTINKFTRAYAKCARLCQQTAKDFAGVVVALKAAVLFQTSLAESERMKPRVDSPTREGRHRREKDVRAAKQRTRSQVSP
jgi:hypothetical protein